MNVVYVADHMSYAAMRRRSLCAQCMWGVVGWALVAALVVSTYGVDAAWPLCFAFHLWLDVPLRVGESFFDDDDDMRRRELSIVDHVSRWCRGDASPQP